MASQWGRSFPGWAAALAAGFVIGAWLAPAGDRRVFAVTSQAENSFAVCTTPLEGGTEALFILDFDTGDLSGGVLDGDTSKFGATFRHNVIKDLGLKPGKLKNPRFTLVSGVANLGAAAATLAQSVLYVTDANTGVTIAYGIPWNPQGGGRAALAPLVPLDKVAPRGGGMAQP